MSKLSIIAPINFLSYGKIGVYVVSELMKFGHDVSLFPIGRSECSVKHEKYIKQSLQNSEFYDLCADCVRIWHQFDLAQFVGKGSHIGFPVFELNTFTDREKHHLKSCDKVFVCSKWAQNIIDLQTFRKSHVVPLGVDREIFYEKQSTRSSTVFINIGKWEKRKGHDILPIIFNQAFTENDDVELWMMVDNPFLRNEEVSPWRNLYRNTPLKHKIRFIPHVETDEQVADIIRQTDCGIFPTRAEGFCLPALELLSCGKHLIITDYSAQTEFCTNENSLLVPINELEPAYDGKWFFNQGEWGKIDKYQIDCCVAYMRQIHQQKQKGELTINIKGIETAKRFSWKNTAETIAKILF